MPSWYQKYAHGYEKNALSLNQSASSNFFQVCMLSRVLTPDLRLELKKANEQLIIQLFAFWLHFTSEPQSMNHSRKNTSQFVNVYMNAISFYKKDYKRDNVLW